MNRILSILIIVCGGLIAPSTSAQDIQVSNDVLFESDQLKLEAGPDAELELKKEDLRKKMHKWHQIIGYVTLGGMAAQGVVGFQLENGKSVLELHKWLAVGVYASYTTTASLVLLAPKGKEKLRGGRVGLHRTLALVHATGMLSTFISGELAVENPDLKSLHRGLSIGTFVVFATAAVIMTF